MTQEINLNIVLSEDEINNLVSKILNEFKNMEYKVIGSGVKVATVKLAEASKENRWKYYLDYFPDTNRITLTVKASDRQPERYAILRVSSKIVYAEDFNKFINRIAKIYLILKKLREKIEGGKEELI